MDEFGDDVWEAQHWENAAEDEESDEEYDGEFDQESDEDSQESDEVVRDAVATLQAGETIFL